MRVLKILFSQYLKSLARSTRFDTNLIIKILISIGLINICIIVFFFGSSFGELVSKFNPSVDKVMFLNKGLIYWIPIDFLLRYFFQKGNFRLIKSYLHLPIRRSKIISYILGLEFFNIFNLFLILFFIPFVWFNIFPNYGWILSILYLLNILFILGILTYSSVLIRNLSDRNFLFSLIPILWIILVIVLKIFCETVLGKLADFIFSNILFGNYLTLIICGLLIAFLIIFNILIVKQLLYNIFTNGDKVKFRIKDSKRLKETRNLYNLFEINLIMRNKRIRSIFTVPIYLVLITYALFLLKPINDSYLVFFWFICLSGAWGYSYLQYIFSFESSFFDFMWTSNFDFHKYFRAKYTFIVLVSLLLVLSILPVLIIRNQNLFVVFTALLYNIGIGFFFILSSGTFNRARMDLNNHLLFNYQGNNPLQIISICISITLPLGFLVFSSTILNLNASLIFLNIISIISLLNYNKWFRMIYKQISKKKYSLIEEYRK